MRPRSDEYADFYAPYVAAVEGSLFGALEADGDAWAALLRDIPDERAGYRYADAKWTIREVVGHVIDSERMFGVRAMAFARGDEARFPGFDQDAYVAAAGSDARPLSELAEEWAAVRRCTLFLLRSLPEEAWDRRGIASDVEFTVRGLAWIIAGHSRHHRNVLAERYLA